MKKVIAVFSLVIVSISGLAQEPQPAAPAPRQQGIPGPFGGPGGPGGRMARGPLGGMAAGFVQNPQIDTTPPELPADFKSGGVLIFSKTSGFREEAAIQASDVALSVLAKQRGLPYFVTENGAVMNPAQLSKFKVVIWNNNSGDIFNEEQRAAFKNWIEAGGSSIAIHGAGGDPASFPAPRTSSAWKWYIENVIGAQFRHHSQIMPGDIKVEDTRSRIMKGLPAVWHRAEEWYAFADNPRSKPGFHILASVDEKSYTPGTASMGADHPLIWWHCVGKGRALYSALGHGGMMYSEPLVIQFLDNAIGWGMAESGRTCEAAR